MSVCVTTLNEEGSIGELLESLLKQSRKPGEIVIVDGGSTDGTVEMIRHWQKKDRRIRLLSGRHTRARGRNLGIEMAKNQILALTDAGCIAKKDWLEKISEPLKDDNVGVVAGFYEMVGENQLQKAMGTFLGTRPADFDGNFLPSTRSMALRKRVWEEVGGFPERKENSAEDTEFNYRALRLGVKYARVKSARVEWGMPKTLREFFEKIFTYARWDGRTGIFIFPGKGLGSHNLKAVSIWLRYGLGFLIFVANYKFGLVLVFLYFCWVYRKAGFWGIILQLTADVAVAGGFIFGLHERNN